MKIIKLYKNCIVCGKEIKKQFYHYKRICSGKCQLKRWRENNPEKSKKLNSWRNLSKYRWQNKIKRKCLICGFDRTIDFCHIVARKNNGGKDRKNLILLCPNHHRLFDENKLTKQEKIIVNKKLNNLV